MKNPDEAPLVSIVIPTRNRPEAIRECVSACLSVDYPRNRYDILVIDDGSEPPVAPFEDPLVRVMRQPFAGPAAARNHGIHLASGDWIAFTDDDCRPRPDWLRHLTGRLSNAPWSLIGGHTVNALSEDAYAATSQLLIDFFYEYFAQYPLHKFFTSNNLLASRERLMAIGGFDEGFPLAAAEDRDLCDRWTEREGSLFYEPCALIDHFHRMSFSRFLRQHVRYGRGAWLLRTKRAARGISVRPEPPKFYIGLFTAPFRCHSTGMALRLAVLVFLSQVFNIAGFIAEAFKHGQRENRTNLRNIHTTPGNGTEDRH